MANKKVKPPVSNDSKKMKCRANSLVPKCERAAQVYAQRLGRHIGKERGQFVRDEGGSLHVILDDRRIHLDLAPENHTLAKLMLDSCKVSTLTLAARAAIQRLQVEAAGKAERIKLRFFSAVSPERNRVYIPVDGGRLLEVTAEQIQDVRNGENRDGFWVEHPEKTPFKYEPTLDCSDGLVHFERLIVETQACLHSAMRWFVAMHEALFPYIRDAFPARFIVVHIGASQQGKTTGARRFVLAHGLSDVKGDYTVAALGNMGDIGLLVMDNKEQANFSRDLIDFCLYLATGAERGRSSKDGVVRRSGSRSVGVITTIEGVHKNELQNRCVEVQYKLAGKECEGDKIETEIRQRRSEISSALICVIQQWLRNRSSRKLAPNPVPSFKEHFAALCDLLRAYGEVAKHPAEWAEGIIEAWDRILGQREVEEDELEFPVLRVLRGQSDILRLSEGRTEHVNYRGRQGALFVTDCGTLLAALQDLKNPLLGLPRTPTALGRRLRGRKYMSFQVLDDESAPELPALRRRANHRPLGIFVPNDSMTGDDRESNTSVIAQPIENEQEPSGSDSMTVELSKSK